MKKLVAFLVVLVLLASMTASSLASSDGTSIVFAVSDLSVSNLTGSDLGRATAVVLAALDGMTVLGLDIDKCDFGRTCYVGNYNGHAVDVFIPRSAGGYYNIEWFSYTNNIFLYEFSSYGYSDIVSNNPYTTYYSVKSSDIQYVLNQLNGK